MGSQPCTCLEYTRPGPRTHPSLGPCQAGRTWQKGIPGREGARTEEGKQKQGGNERRCLLSVGQGQPCHPKPPENLPRAPGHALLSLSLSTFLRPALQGGLSLPTPRQRHLCGERAPAPSSGRVTLIESHPLSGHAWGVGEMRTEGSAQTSGDLLHAPRCPYCPSGSI